jgi:hypothetical protein
MGTDMEWSTTPVLPSTLAGGWSEVCGLQCGVTSVRGFQVGRIPFKMERALFSGKPVVDMY